MKTINCPHCGAMLLRSYGTEAKWECHNDQCELNRLPAGTEAALSVGTGIVLLLRAARFVGSAILVVGVVWLLWRAL